MEFEIIRRLVGDATPEQLRYVECFIAEPVSLFVPAVGPCDYAQTRDHSHPAYSFVLSFDQNTRIAVNGRITGSEAGMVFAMAPETAHHELSQDEPPRYVAIFIDREHFESQLSGYGEKPRGSFHCRSFYPKPELMTLLRTFMNECETDLPGRREILSALGLRITHSLIRAALDLSPRPSSGATRLEIHRAIQYLNDHFAERISIGELARVAGLSSAHFSRLFRRETGDSPLDYLIKIRIQRSRMLLRAGGYTVTEIALKCGFSTPSHFADCFRRHCGVPPSEYLKIGK